MSSYAAIYVYRFKKKLTVKNDPAKWLTDLPIFITLPLYHLNSCFYPVKSDWQYSSSPSLNSPFVGTEPSFWSFWKGIKGKKREHILIAPRGFSSVSYLHNILDLQVAWLNSICLCVARAIFFLRESVFLHVVYFKVLN